MKIVRYPNVEEFWHAAAVHYVSDPVRNTVALTVLHRLREGVPYGTEPPLFLGVHDGKRPCGAAFQTPPWPMQLSGLPEDATSEAVAAIHHGQPIRGGIVGLRPAVDTAVTTLRTLGVDIELAMSERLYRLAALRPPHVRGRARRAVAEDVQLLSEFHVAFEIEAIGARRTDTTAEETIRAGMATGRRAMLWEVHGRPVAVASASPAILGMSRIGPVYTEPAARGNGYGSAVTAAMTADVEAAGAQEIVLLTDLANPTSNSIYRRIGYEPVCDAAQYRIGGH